MGFEILSGSVPWSYACFFFLLCGNISRYSTFFFSTAKSTIVTPEAVVQRCSVKKLFLKIPQNSQESTCVGVFIKKETLTLVFPCEICKIFKSIFFLLNTFGGCFYNATETPNKHQNSVSRLIQNLIKFVTKNLFFLPRSYILFINTNRTN